MCLVACTEMISISKVYSQTSIILVELNFCLWIKAPINCWCKDNGMSPLLTNIECNIKASLSSKVIGLCVERIKPSKTCYRTNLKEPWSTLITTEYIRPINNTIKSNISLINPLCYALTVSVMESNTFKLKSEYWCKILLKFNTKIEIKRCKVSKIKRG